MALKMARTTETQRTNGQMRARMRAIPYVFPSSPSHSLYKWLHALATVVSHSRDCRIGLLSTIRFAMATVVEDCEASQKTSAGRGLSWNNDELFALARGAAVASQDPAIGAGMSNAQFGRKIRVQFTKDSRRPAAACSEKDGGGNPDNRRWDARSADACIKKWIIVRRECSKFKAVRDRLMVMELTGNPNDDDLDRCAHLLYI